MNSSCACSWINKENKKKKGVKENFIFTKVQLYREGIGTPLQYSCLENSMGGEAWKAALWGR